MARKRKLAKRYEPCVCGHQRLVHQGGEKTVLPALVVCLKCHLKNAGDRHAWHKFKLNNLEYIILNK